MNRNASETKYSLKRFKNLICALLAFLPICALIISLFIGRYDAGPATVLHLLGSKIFPFIKTEWPLSLETAILQVRLPRILIAVAVGASLSVSGTAYQGIFRNPLVSSQILGVASGASFGAALGILLSAPGWVVQLSAFSFGMIAVGLALLITRFYRSSPALTLVLAGVIIGSFFSSLVSLITYTADPNIKLPAIVFWLMGSLSSSSKSELAYIIPPMAFSTIILLVLRWRINILSMGEEDAKAMGINTGRLRLIIIVCCTVLTSASVCVSGVIGWVGLVIPHFGRILVGPDHRVLLPASLSIGAVYLLIMDNIARSVSNSEIPLGILTGMIGAPVFAYLLTKGTRW